MAKKVIATERAPKAIGPYAQGWTVDKMVFTSGQLGIDSETGRLAEGIEAQTHAAIKNVQAILKESGSDLKDIVKTTVFVQNLDDFAVVNEVYGNYFQEPYPARSCVQVAKLPMGGLVEIECIVVKC